MVTVWRRSTTAELCWIAPDGPRGIPVVPLVWESAATPCVALPLAHLDAVDTMSNGCAAFSVGGSPDASGPALVATGRVDIRFDLDGADFVEHLLDQEAVKHPPTRLRADSIMARRENWWWVPRLLVTLVETESVREVPARPDPGDAVLVRDSGRGPRVDVVTAPAWPDPPGDSDGAAGVLKPVELWRRDGGSLDGSGEAAFAFGHRHSPDFERWERWHRAGTLVEDALEARAGAGVPGAEAPPFGIVERIRNHREVARACRAGIATAEARLLGR